MRLLGSASTRRIRNPANGAGLTSTTLFLVLSPMVRRMWSPPAGERVSGHSERGHQTVLTSEAAEFEKEKRLLPREVRLTKTA